MISRTFNTRMPNSSRPRWKTRYLPARSSVFKTEIFCSAETGVGRTRSPCIGARNGISCAYFACHNLRKYLGRHTVVGAEAVVLGRKALKGTDPDAQVSCSHVCK